MNHTEQQNHALLTDAEGTEGLPALLSVLEAPSLLPSQVCLRHRLSHILGSLLDWEVWEPQEQCEESVQREADGRARARGWAPPEGGPGELLGSGCVGL